MQIHDSLQDHGSARTTAEYEEMTIDEIFNGSKSDFPGLLNFVEKYVELKNPDQQTRDKLSRYIDFIRGKTQGPLFCYPSSLFLLSRSYLYDDCDMDKKFRALSPKLSV